MEQFGDASDAGFNIKVPGWLPQPEAAMLPTSLFVPGKACI